MQNFFKKHPIPTSSDESVEKPVHGVDERDSLVWQPGCIEDHDEEDHSGIGSARGTDGHQCGCDCNRNHLGNSNRDK